MLPSVMICAQLALALGEDPSPFLQKKAPHKAHAQLCVTSNTDTPLHLQAGDQIFGWKNREIIQQMKHVQSATLWDPFPFTIHLKTNGHPNFGEMTVSGKTPLEAFQNLLALCITEPPVLQTSRGEVTSSLWPLRSFGRMMPGLERFSITHALTQDLPALQELLQTLTPRAAGSLEALPRQVYTLVARDLLTTNKNVVGTVSYHTWDQLRAHPFNKAGYIQDLVIAEGYRRLGIGSTLVEKAKCCMQKEGVSKITLAYEAPEASSSSQYHCFYGELGFSPAGVFMAQYLPCVPFDETLLAQEGDWLYGQHLIETYCLRQGGDALGVYPDYKVLDKESLLTPNLRGLSGAYFIKFSR